MIDEKSKEYIEFNEYLCEVFKKENFDLEDSQIKRFYRYFELLIDWNNKINLTAITEMKEVIVKHFLDSVMLLKYVDLKQNSSLADIGTGAGFPAIPVKIMRPDVDITLIDSLNKRIKFLDEVSQELNLGARCIHIRAEEAGKNKDFREKFDYVTARAVANLRDLSEYCIPLVKVNGYFVSLKGYEIDEEVESARKAISILGGELEKKNKFILNMTEKRSIICIKKISQTSTKYPRPANKISKNPLI